MDKVKLVCAVATFFCLLTNSCVTKPALPPNGVERIAPLILTAKTVETSFSVILPQKIASARYIPSPHLFKSSYLFHDRYTQLTSLDLSTWPYGWILDKDQASRFGLSERFWSDQKPLWNKALDPQVLPSIVIRTLESILKNAEGPDEHFRAVWHLWLIYSQENLFREAREWLDKAAALKSSPVIALEQSWDDTFRLGDFSSAKVLLPGLQVKWLVSDDERKAGLLRQRLYLGNKSLEPMGADDNVSTIQCDQDDLWIGTWNGAIVRWSLTTDQSDLILSAGSQVSPIKLLVITGWFVYAFQDKSLVRYSKVTGSWKIFDYPPGWTGLRVQGAVSDGQERLWVATLGQGLWKWDRGNWDLVDDRGGGPFLNSLTSDGRGGFWVGTKDKGLWDWKDGVWTPVLSVDGPVPTNISVVQPSPSGDQILVGTWGEGAWTLNDGRLKPVTRDHEFVVGAAWDDNIPVWATLDEGIHTGDLRESIILGPKDGVPIGGVSSVAIWNHRLIWGTNGQGIGWWSGNENPALHR